MADALSRYRQAEPSKDALKRYRDAPSGDTLGALAKYLGLQGYWDRQGQIAQDGLTMAEQGAQSVRGGNLSGLGGLALGPLNYFASPITALLPTSDETYAAKDIPEWAKPSVAGTLGAMAAVMPGPKTRGLGKGMANLADDATAAERAALGSRLEAEAAQAVPVRQYTPEEIARLKASLAASKTTEDEAIAAAKKTIPPIEDFIPATRDQALRNLTEAPEGITAYHGSPHTFDKFDMSKIGTGHGKQQQGSGSYFSSEESLGERYRINHADKSPEAIAEKYKANWGSQAEEKLAQYAAKRATEMRPESVEPFNKALDLIRGGGDTSRKGALYKVRLNAPRASILDMTDPSTHRPEIGDPMSLTPETAKKHGVKVLAYDAANESGIKGAKNYVVFDDSIIDILKRYGIPMTAGVGGAMVVSGQNMPPDLAAQMGPQG